MRKTGTMLFRICMLLTLAAVIAITGRAVIGAEASALPELTAEQIYQADADSVFYLKVYKEDGTLKTVGTGFLIRGGKALTAYHVIADGASYEAVFDDGKSVRGITVTAADQDLDAAVLSIQAGGRKGLELASDEARHGQRAFAMGYPLKGTKMISEGIVNAPAAKVNGVNRLLTSAQVASGMSGGPLFDRYGKVAGLISGSFRTMDNIHLCVSVADIRKDLLKEEGK
ncbi:S1 family peptidase [Paenibacillus thermotolerans]|uniref:S1 family peptidase n=1 Tax=Paenibacillus thermotolerans TaxID=3027807 RepID=UPI002368B69E|nr:MULTISPECIES: serine protease [unclassified Paenibacillus]